MIVKYSQLIHKPLVELKNQSHLGVISDIILTKTNFKLAALIIKDIPFWPARKAVTESSIVEIDLAAVMVNNEDDLSYIRELPRVKEALENGFSGVGQKVVTKSKKTIGHVYDYTMDSESGFLFKLYIKSVLSERIISRTAIVEYKNSKIIIEDDFEAIKSTEVAFSPEVA